MTKRVFRRNGSQYEKWILRTQMINKSFILQEKEGRFDSVQWCEERKGLKTRKKRRRTVKFANLGSHFSSGTKSQLKQLNSIAPCSINYQSQITIHNSQAQTRFKPRRRSASETSSQNFVSPKQVQNCSKPVQNLKLLRFDKEILKLPTGITDLFVSEMKNDVTIVSSLFIVFFW